MPEPTRTVVRYDVSCLPIGHRDHAHYAISIVLRPDGLWIVKTRKWDEYYDTTGALSARPVPMDLDTADSVADRVSRDLVVGGRTVDDVLAQDEQRAQLERPFRRNPVGG